MLKATAVVVFAFAMGIVVGLAADRMDGDAPTPLRVCVEPTPDPPSVLP